MSEASSASSAASSVSFHNAYNGLGRQELEKRCAAAERERDAYLANLTNVQARSTELLQELRLTRMCMILPGWTCGSCHVFNGEAKEVLSVCRCCQAPRPA
jgi:hypothetical protein